MKVRLLVIAKEPVPGRVKTRLCPPCTPEQAAAVARAALDQTLATVDSIPAARRVLVLRGTYHPPTGWSVVGQRGHELGDRLAHAFVDAGGGQPTLLVGMDTPQLTPSLVATVAAGLAQADAAIGPALDGGWWALALREPAHALVLRPVPMSTSDTYGHTVGALQALGLRVVRGPMLRDVDTAADAWEVARLVPESSFAVAVRANVLAKGLVAASVGGRPYR
jgi:glycosyltransferase A (GT-A) superfamily protein (DUF2064 family)